MQDFGLGMQSDYGFKIHSKIILEDTMNKLMLSKIPHVNPYKVTWLNKGQSVLVNQQTWVEFTIAGYKDKLLCDVLPMDACHLLLGRPWQFDRGAVYDGKENSISFKKDGNTFKIQSLLEEDEPQSKTPSILIINGKGFIKNRRNVESEGYVIVLKPKEEEKSVAEALPSKIQNIIDMLSY